MHRIYILLLSALIFVSCSKEEKISTDPNARLSFSTDTLLFDTVFTTVGSTTRKLKIYNKNKNALRIREIKLAGGNTSEFKININGSPVSTINDQEIGAKDSITIFIKVNINPNSANLPFIVTDSLLFETNGNKQKVNLAAYGENANFIDAASLTGNTVWNNNLPYVIYNSALIEQNSTLTIDAGARIYFHKNSKLYIAGTLKANGTPADSITFSSDRREALYKDEPGQWGGLHFLRSSKNNIVSNASIQNATIGIRVDSLSENSNPKLILNNCIVKNMEVTALALYNADLKAFNNLIYNCGQFLVYAVLGGNYDFKQNTFAGYNFTFARQNPALYFSDTYSAGNSIQSAALNLNLTNNIIWGNLDNELLLERKATFDFNTQIFNNLIKTNKSEFQINGNLINADPQFVTPRNENYRLTDQSPALNKGINLTGDSYSPFLIRDIEGKSRIFPSELGAYEFK
ncbi:MAG: hypothetical protein ABI390_03585 [Daejeonella sp.]